MTHGFFLNLLPPRFSFIPYPNLQLRVSILLRTHLPQFFGHARLMIYIYIIIDCIIMFPHKLEYPCLMYHSFTNYVLGLPECCRLPYNITSKPYGVSSCSAEVGARGTHEFHKVGAWAPRATRTGPSSDGSGD